MLESFNQAAFGGGDRGSRHKSDLSVGIATSGRFHLLDLARELDALGVPVRFYSYVSRGRAAKFGLPARCHVALLPFLFPLVGLERLFPKLLPRTVERLMCLALDLMVILRMRRCDVFICMSGMYRLAPRFAKWRYGAYIVLHRSSRHIVSQAEILDQVPGAQKVTQFIIERELYGYGIADHIAVPSTHVVESFEPWPEQARKVFLNPYGVDLDQFPLRSGSLKSDTPTVIFVGQWSYRKGVDVLVDAITQMSGVRLVHVGHFLDAPFPDHPRFVHVDSVPQDRLQDYYKAAHVFGLASREDGFGFVLCQSLASGLPVVCTDRTGGPDLAQLPNLGRLIRVVPAGDQQALKQALLQALDEATGKASFEPITQAERASLSWKCYAIRDLRFTREMLEIYRGRSSEDSWRSAHAE
jgi:alpha-maltose-1-phosphate synthase